MSATVPAEENKTRSSKAAAPRTRTAPTGSSATSCPTATLRCARPCPIFPKRRVNRAHAMETPTAAPWGPGARRQDFRGKRSVRRTVMPAPQIRSVVQGRHAPRCPMSPRYVSRRAARWTCSAPVVNAVRRWKCGRTTSSLALRSRAPKRHRGLHATTRCSVPMARSAFTTMD